MRCLLGSHLLGTIREVVTVCTLHTWVEWFSVGVPSRYMEVVTRFTTQGIYLSYIEIHLSVKNQAVPCLLYLISKKNKFQNFFKNSLKILTFLIFCFDMI